MSTPTDTAPLLPQQLDQTPPQSSWRDDLLEVSIVAVVIGSGGVLAGLVMIAAGWIATLVSFGVYLACWLFACWLPFAILAAYKTRSVTERHRLAWTRSQAERWTLLTMLDTDGDGNTEDDEIAAFLRYAIHCWRGGETTASRAQRMGIPGPVWQRYRNALIALGLARPVGKRGGMGFEILPQVQQTAWPRIERRITEALHARVRLDITPAPEHHTRNVSRNKALTSNPGGEGKGTRAYTREPVSTLPPDVAVGEDDEW